MKNNTNDTEMFINCRILRNRSVKKSIQKFKKFVKINSFAPKPVYRWLYIRNRSEITVICPFLSC